MSLTIRLPYPPSVNTYYRSVGGRNILSKRGREYKSEAASAITEHLNAAVLGPCAIHMMVTVPDRRRRDLDNLHKAVLDALVIGGLIEDDSLVRDLRITWHGVQSPGWVDVIVDPWPCGTTTPPRSGIR